MTCHIGLLLFRQMHVGRLADTICLTVEILDRFHLGARESQLQEGQVKTTVVVVEETIARRNALYKKVSEYNSREDNADSKIIAIPRISNEDEVSSPLYGTIVYVKAENDTKLSFIGEGSAVIFADIEAAAEDENLKAAVKILPAT